MNKKFLFSLYLRNPNNRKELKGDLNDETSKQGRARARRSTSKRWRTYRVIYRGRIAPPKNLLPVMIATLSLKSPGRNTDIAV